MYEYPVRVRGTTYVWGSAGLSGIFPLQLVLVINNNAFGDVAKIASESPTGTRQIGTLQPGECWTLPLEGLHGVTATCETDTTLSCAILYSR
jgi:hypothetical protein